MKIISWEILFLCYIYFAKNDDINHLSLKLDDVKKTNDINDFIDNKDEKSF